MESNRNETNVILSSSVYVDLSEFAIVRCSTLIHSQSAYKDTFAPIHGHCAPLRAISTRCAPQEDVPVRPFPSALSPVLSFRLGWFIADLKTEKEVLMQLYNGNGGTNWTRKGNWTIGQPCANQWEGVDCVNDRVVALRLSSNGLSGSLSDNWYNMTKLQNL